MDKYFTCAEPLYFTFAEMTHTETWLDNRPTTWEQVSNLHSHSSGGIVRSGFRHHVVDDLG